MPERPSLSPAFEKLRKICATCGKPLPCPLHDRALLEAILKPPEPENPWDKMEREDVGESGNAIRTIPPLPDGTCIIGGVAGLILQLDPFKPKGQRRQALCNYGDGHSDIIFTAASFPDGAFIVSGTSGRILQYDPSKFVC